MNDLLMPYAELCAIAYADDSVSKYRALGYKAIALHQRGAIDEGYALLKDGVLKIVMRGTDGPNDWVWRNLGGITPVRSPLIQGSVHPGLLAGAETLIQPIQSLLDMLDCEYLAFTGHSKGGAIAHLLGHVFKRYSPSVVSFGAPRAFGDVERLSKHYRVVHELDPVARIPPRSLGWRHVGEANVILPDGRIESGVNAWRSAMARSGNFDVIKNVWHDRLKSHFDYGAGLRQLWQDG
jgi:Lipase (class 3)